MARSDKAAAVAELAEEFRGASAVVLTEYRGLAVRQLTDLRRSLGVSASYAVVKNTLTKIAAKEAGIEGIEDHLVGPSAIAFVKGDPVEAAKGLRDFARANPVLVIKGGVLEGKLLTADEIGKLADLESREVLLAGMAGAMKASLASAASLFQAPLAQTARLVEALRQQVEAHGSASPRTARSSRPPFRGLEAADVAMRDRPERGLTAESQPSPTRDDHPASADPPERNPPSGEAPDTDDLLDAFKEMSLIELSEFVKKFEETFEVTAAAPVAVAAAGPVAAGAGAAEEAVEQDEFDVVLEAAGDKKIQVIKEVRALTSLGLKEAKDLVDGTPKPVLEKVNKEAADKTREQLEAAGACVTVK